MYFTDTMRKILTSPMAQKMIQEISPRYGEAYVFLWLMQIFGLEMDKISTYCEEYINQTVPQTATWSLDYWEKMYNIVPDPSWDIERRRTNILNRIRQKGPMNPSKLSSIASVAAGAPVRIEENTGKNRFTMWISGTPDDINEDDVRAAVEAAKPAQLIYDIFYETAIKGMMYAGGSIYAQYPNGITLNQLNQL